MIKISRGAFVLKAENKPVEPEQDNACEGKVYIFKLSPSSSANYCSKNFSSFKKQDENEIFFGNCHHLFICCYL